MLVLAAVALCAAVASAIPADINADGRVDLADFALLATDWQQSGASLGGDLNSDGVVDLADLVILAEYWLWHGRRVPTAHAVSAAGITHEWIAIELSGDDDGRPKPPGKLRYSVQTYPASPAVLIDPTRGAGLFFARHTPYTLSSWGKHLMLWTDTADTLTFDYIAHDGGTAPDAGASDPNTITVTVAANPHNHLSFDGRGTATFGHQSVYNVSAGWAVCLYVRTTRPFGGLIGKRNGSAPGWQIDIVSGRVQLTLVDDAESVTTLTYPERIDDGSWGMLAAGVYVVDDVTYAGLEINGDFVSARTALSSASGFDTTADVVLGRTERGGYRGDVDKLRFFAAYNPGTFGGMIYEPDDRQSTGESALGFGVASVVRFMFDEGSGTTVTDDKQGYTGTLSGGVQWRPYYDPFMPMLN